MTLSSVPSTLKPIFFFCARTSLREVQDDGEAKFNKMYMEDMINGRELSYLVFFSLRISTIQSASSVAFRKF